MIRVGVFGARGKMGATVCEAVRGDPDLELVSEVDLGDDIEVMKTAEVMVDFTRPDVVLDNVRWSLEHGIHCVVGTSGLSPETLHGLDTSRANLFVAPNFALGAVLAMRFAREAARYYGSCEVIEQHHNQKLDAPSGTATATASQIAEVWAANGRPSGGEPAPGEQELIDHVRGGNVGGVRVHSVRMRGLVAHQEVLLGGPGEILTIRHDSIDRTSFMPGVLLAVKRVGSHPGVTIGLEHLL